MEKDKPVLLFTNLKNGVYTFFYSPLEGKDSVIFLTIDFELMVYINLDECMIGTVAGEFEVGEEEAKFINKIWSGYIVSY